MVFYSYYYLCYYCFCCYSYLYQFYYHSYDLCWPYYWLIHAPVGQIGMEVLLDVGFQDGLECLVFVSVRGNVDDIHLAMRTGNGTP